MKAIKRLTTFLFTFVIVLILIPIINVKAAITDTKIISDTKVTAKQAEEWAKSKGATDTFVGLAELYWNYAPAHGNVNPAIAYVQAAKETGYGNFGGVLDESYHNPCGLKTSSGGADTDPNAHQRFETWDEGVQAHLDHLALYAGASGYPRSDTYDPRQFITIKGNAVTINALSGKWAPSFTYGQEINELYNNLLIAAGIVSQSEVNASNVASNSGISTAASSTTSAGAVLDTTNATSKPQATQTGPAGVQATEPIRLSIDNNANISSSIGWKLENGNWYYYRSDGSKAAGWIKPDSNWYYLYSDGVMAKGWINQNGKWYYLKSSGAMALGWINDNNKWYYIQGDGSMTTGLKLIDGKKYFLDSSGEMRVGWTLISGQWYFFNTSGNMLTGWINANGNWYYLYSNGIMATGWINLNGNWYYLRSSGARATGWIVDGKDYYYLQPSTGIMAKDTTINGWKIGSDGKRGSRIPGSTSGKVIVLDPGHNFGGDDGAYATSNGVTYSERDLNMQVADKLKAKLEALGYTVIMTRYSSDRNTDDVNTSLTNRVNIANNAKADLFVSLHHNSASPAANGVEVYYSSRPQDDSFGGAYSDYKLSTSMSLASAVASSITSSTGAQNRGARDSNYFVCRNTSMPAILIEFGFITNPDEAQKCANSSYQDLEATAVASAISAAF
ncbi:N-acetylmuramoyl-L-alanine amidase [Clostridium sp.]|uniref:N-acetylmuramoyl-L-alanine amidase n=1 Tax=Clostridium sp. TaxID=1506 RepID=UPI002608AED6|nr:N-acetylmuramoyl-L-alanine amidase [Clostridium sp.]